MQLSTSLATFSVLTTCRASRALGVPVRLHKANDGAFHSVCRNLRLTTEIELADGTTKTVAELMASHAAKVRCQAPFRASCSLAAFFNIDHAGRPFVWDSGTSTKHTLGADEFIRRAPDLTRESLVREVTARLADLIGAENAAIVLNEDALRMAWDSAFFAPAKSKFGLINRNNDYIELSGKDFVSLFRRTFGRVFHTELVTEVVAELAVDRELKPHQVAALAEQIDDLQTGPLVCQLKLYRQVTSLAPLVDMFVARGSMTVLDGVAVITLPHRPFVSSAKVPLDVQTHVIADYLRHFPEFQDFLEFVLHARFACDRREAFAWLHASSSWGKGFLVEAFARLGLVVEIPTKEIEAAMEGRPVGLSPSDMLRAWILFVDEFKKASSELKQLNSKITLSPKNQLRCTVPVYAKLFASAESVHSLVGDGVEAQFDRRFAYLAPTTGLAKLDDRALVLAMGTGAYLGAVSAYAASFLNSGVERLRKMGKAESEKVAGNFVRAYQAARKLSGKFGGIEASIEALALEIHRALVAFGRWRQQVGLLGEKPAAVQGLGARLEQLLIRKTDIGFVAGLDHGSARRNVLVLRDPVGFVRAYIASGDDRAATGKLLYKSDGIAALLGENQHRCRLYAAPTGNNPASNRAPDSRLTGIVVELGGDE